MCLAPEGGFSNHGEIDVESHPGMSIEVRSSMGKEFAQGRQIVIQA